jgi:hypothetical protein
MKPRSIPKSIPADEWQSWPTFDDLRAKVPSMKLHKLRAMLRDVTCYRCPDQTARYVQEEIDELIEDEADLDEKVKESVGADGAANPALFEMVMFREAMRGMAEVLKGMGEMRKMIGDMSSAALEPMKLGLQLVKENTDMLRERVQHFEGWHDNTLATYENLASQQTDRDLRVQRAQGAEKVRQKASDLVLAYLPTVLNDLKQSMLPSTPKPPPPPDAAAALDALRSLEPEVLNSIVDADTHTPAQRAAWARARDLINQSRQQGQQGQQGQQSNHHAPS